MTGVLRLANSGATIATALLLLAGGTAPASGAAGAQPAEPAPRAGGVVVVLDPLVRFERIQDGSDAPASSYDGAGYAAALRGRAATSMATRGLQPIRAESLGAADAPATAGAAVEALQRLRAQSGKLARGVLADDARESLARVAAARERCHVLVLFVKGKLGPRGSWDPNSGAITSAMNSMLLQAALVSTDGGQGGLAGMMMKGEALGTALAQLLSSVPPQPKPAA